MRASEFIKKLNGAATEVVWAYNGPIDRRSFSWAENAYHKAEKAHLGPLGGEDNPIIKAVFHLALCKNNERSIDLETLVLLLEAWEFSENSRETELVEDNHSG